MSADHDRLVRAERVAAELRAATAEAAGVLKDLTAVIRSARTQIDEYAAQEVGRVMNLHLTICQGAVDQWYQDMVANVAQINARFDTAEAAMMDRLDKTFRVPLDQAAKFEAALRSVDYVDVTTQVRPG